MPKYKKNTKVKYFLSNSQRHRVGRIVLLGKSSKVLSLILILVVGSLFAGLVILQKSKDSGAAATQLFDGSKVSNWQNKHVNTSCGSYLKDVNTAPAGRSGSSIEVFIKDGCLWNGTERSELSTDHSSYTFKEGTVWYIDFYQKFDQLANVHGGDFDIWLQTHFNGGGSQPNVILATDSKNQMTFKTSRGCGHTKHWGGPVIETGKWYKFTLGVKFSSSSTSGWVELKLDGKTVLPKKSVATLDKTVTSCPNKPTVKFDATRGYLKKGVYRNPSHSGNQKYTLHGLKIFNGDPTTSTAITSPPTTPVPAPTPAPVSPPTSGRLNPNDWAKWQYFEAVINGRVSVPMTKSQDTRLLVQLDGQKSGYKADQYARYCIEREPNSPQPKSITYTVRYNAKNGNTLYFYAGDSNNKLWQASNTEGSTEQKTISTPLSSQQRYCFGNVTLPGLNSYVFSNHRFINVIDYKFNY